LPHLSPEIRCDPAVAQAAFAGITPAWQNGITCRFLSGVQASLTLPTDTWRVSAG
jgi:hypothetical protein